MTGTGHHAEVLRAAARVILVCVASSGSAFAEPRIDRIEPLCLVIGGTTEVTVFGDQLSAGESPPDFWSGFTAEWKPVKPEGEWNPRELKLQVTIPQETKPGAHAVRCCTTNGISAPFLLLLDASSSTYSFRLEASEPVVHTFEATKGQALFCEAWSRRLNQDTDLIMSVHDADGKEIASADDDEVIGFDPTMRLNVPESGEYTLRIHDNEWRSGASVCLRIGDQPLVDFASSDDSARTSIDPQPLSVSLNAGQYLTVTPRTRAIGSPAMLFMELHEQDGPRVAQCGTGDVSDEPLRYRADKSREFHLIVRDLLQRSDLPYEIDVSTDEAPFEVQLDGGARDRHVVASGESFKIRFRATRYGYDGPITITCPELDLLELTDNQIPEKKNDVEANIKFNGNVAPGTLFTFRFLAVAEIEGKSLATSVQTIRQLEKNTKGITEWPNGLDGVCYAVIKDGGKSE